MISLREIGGARRSPVAQVSKPAVSPASKPAHHMTSNALPTWKSAMAPGLRVTLPVPSPIRWERVRVRAPFPQSASFNRRFIKNLAPLNAGNPTISNSVGRGSRRAARALAPPLPRNLPSPYPMITPGLRVTLPVPSPIRWERVRVRAPFMKNLAPLCFSENAISRHQAGFSLIEVMCAILIMGVALVALTHGITTALGSIKDSEVRTTVVSLAAGQLETLRAGGVLLDETTDGDFGESFPKYSFEQTVAPSDVDGLHQVDIVVKDAKSGATLFKLTTLLFDNDYPGSTASDAKEKQREQNKAKNRHRRGS
jgi:prepilin-type N-terminal cleavage/methylation domain-containing protein